MWLITILMNIVAILVIIFTSIFLYFKYKYSHWSRNNIPYLKPIFPYGNAKFLISLDKSFGRGFQEIYLKTKQISKSLGGLYMFSEPCIIIVDPELVKNIIVKDFDFFQDRGLFPDLGTDPLGDNLVALKGLKWKNSRTKITPAFSSGKMKMMFYTMLETSKQLRNVIDEHIENNIPLDTKDIFARFSTDTIGSCAFGLDCNSLKNPDVEFRKYGEKFFKIGLREAIIKMMISNCPSVLRFFKISRIHPDVTDFFMSVLKQTVEYREKHNVHRKDFLDLLIRLKNNQSVLDGQDEIKTQSEGITFNELAAHAFVFFVAGFETSSSTLNFCLFELVNNEKIQEKVRKEVIEIVEKHDGKLTYEAVMEMKYMDKVLNEVLRKYPPIPSLQRECTRNYKVPNTDYVIKKGTEIFVSTLGLQRDPDYYPDPDQFDPERFSEEQKAKRHPYTYLPFGEGPRNCIGSRFAFLQVKIAVCVLLMQYKFTLDPKTILPVKFTTKSMFLSPKNTFWLRATHIKR